jgi:hypothetical protein
MATNDRKVASLSYKRGQTTHSVLTVWESAQYPGSYSISRDKGTDKYPPISLIDVIKGFVAGDGFVNFRMWEQTSAPQRQPQTIQGPRTQADDFGGGEAPFDDGFNDVPF